MQTVVKFLLAITLVLPATAAFADRERDEMCTSFANELAAAEPQLTDATTRMESLRLRISELDDSIAAESDEGTRRELQRQRQILSADLTTATGEERSLIHRVNALEVQIERHCAE